MPELEPSPAPAGSFRIGIDVGGTFTDFVIADRHTGRVVRHKEASVPSDPSMSVVRGLPVLIEKVGASFDDVELIMHGTTLLVNAIIERRGAKVGLVVSRGLRGVLEIGRGRLHSSHNFMVQKEEPLVPRNLVLETSARVNAHGEIIEMPADGELEAIAARLKAEGVEAVTVLLLHSYAYPALENDVADELARLMPGIPITRSAGIWPERREYERALVAIMNAYVQPIMNGYLDRLTARVGDLGIKAPIYITTSNGGTQSIATARARPIEAALSGPASGVVAAIRAASTTGLDRIITVDIGGTSADVSVARGSEPEYTTQTRVGDFPLVTPAVDVSAIGAGGGSIVWIDPQGVLKVGPRSAGADPGPICYGRGATEPTITDCFVVLGFIDPDNFLNGRLRLDRESARKALEALAGRMGLDSVYAVAEAAIRVSVAMMATELHKSLAQRGESARDFALMAFGGAGPMHGNFLASEAGMSSFVIPASPATFCALGAILADVKRDFIRSAHLFLADDDVMTRLAGLVGELKSTGAEWIAAEGDMLGRPEFRVTLDMRYSGQAFDLPVEIPDGFDLERDRDGLVELLHRAHEGAYGFRDEDSGVEITTQRVRVIGRNAPVPVAHLDAAGKEEVPPVAARRLIQRGGRCIDAPVYARSSLRAGVVIDGPAIIEQDDTTIWIEENWSARIDIAGNIIASVSRKEP